MFLKEIEGNKVKLRPYEVSDIVAWQRWDIDLDVQKYMPGPMNTPVSDRKQIEYLKECECDTLGAYWSIVAKEDNALVGSVAITDMIGETGELGIVMGEKEYWGKGIASEAVALAVKFVLNNLNITRVTAEYEEGNVAVQKVLERAGFLKKYFLKGSRTKNNKKINTIVYERTNTTTP